MIDFLPKILSVDVTNKCNRNCLYCRDIHNEKSRELSDDEVFGIVASLVKKIASIEWVKISGGEPLLFSRIDDLVSFCHIRNKKTILQTNGALLTEKNIKGLKEKGLTKIQISVDGYEEINDYLRGENSYKLVMRAVESCERNKMPFQLKCTISNINKKYLEDLFKIASCCHPEKLNFRFLLPIGKAEKRKALHSIDAKERKLIVKKLNQLSDFYKIDIITGDPCSYLYLFKYLRKNKILDYGGACTIGINSIHLSSDGFYRPCSMIKINLGDALKDDFYEIWNNNEFLKRNRKRNFEKCELCFNKKICGGCRALAHSIRGDYFSEDITCFVN